MRKLSEGELVWHGEYPRSCIPKVRAEIAEYLDEDLDDPSDLCFHTVFLGDEMAAGPVVMIWGEDGSNSLHCEYHANSKWVSLDELSDE